MFHHKRRRKNVFRAFLVVLLHSSSKKRTLWAFRNRLIEVVVACTDMCVSAFSFGKEEEKKKFSLIIWNHEREKISICEKKLFHLREKVSLFRRCFKLFSEILAFVGNVFKGFSVFTFALSLRRRKDNQVEEEVVSSHPSNNSHPSSSRRFCLCWRWTNNDSPTYFNGPIQKGKFKKILRCVISTE